MSVSRTALWWARARAGGPQRVPTDEIVPRGMLRVRDPEAGVAWLIPQPPSGADASVLEEFGLTAPPVDRPNETARVLAACLRCCWQDPGVSPWPGVASSFDAAAAVFRAITLRDDQLSDRAMTAALRRLASCGWLLWDPALRTIRLGPRVALWRAADLTSLRELWRNLPDPALLTPTDTEHA